MKKYSIKTMMIILLAGLLLSSCGKKKVEELPSESNPLETETMAVSEVSTETEQMTETETESEEETIVMTEVYTEEETLENIITNVPDGYYSAPLAMAEDQKNMLKMGLGYVEKGSLMPGGLSVSGYFVYYADDEAYYETYEGKMDKEVRELVIRIEDSSRFITYNEGGSTDDIDREAFKRALEPENYSGLSLEISIKDGVLDFAGISY